MLYVQLVPFLSELTLCNLDFTLLLFMLSFSLSLTDDVDGSELLASGAVWGDPSGGYPGRL
jgi:hypothetical protein